MKTLKKNLKNDNDIRQEIRHLGVVMEGVKDDIKLVAEQHGDIIKRLDSQKLDIEVIKTDVGFIKNSLKRKVDVEEFAALERRVALLEKQR